jgi:hypothetical protein
VALKHGPKGLFREGTTQGAWLQPQQISKASAEIDPDVIDAATAYFQYLFEQYGRVPAYQPPFRTVLGFQASHVDTAFYDRFYTPEALSETQRRHMEQWHGGN